MVCEEVLLLELAERAEQVNVLRARFHFHREFIYYSRCCNTSLLIFNISWETVNLIFWTFVVITVCKFSILIMHEFFQRIANF